MSNLTDRAYELAKKHLSANYTEVGTGMEAMMAEAHYRSWAAIWLSGYKAALADEDIRTDE